MPESGRACPVPVAIVIPTIHRSDFIIQQLRYYAAAEAPPALYIGDSSIEGNHAERIRHAIDEVHGRLEVHYFHYPRQRNAVCMRNLLHEVTQPFAAYIADDDYFVPAAVREAAQFLESHPDYESAHGLGVVATVRADGGPDWIRITPYPQCAVEDTTAAGRLLRFMAGYFPSYFSVHRTAGFRQAFAAIDIVEENSFAELYPCCMSIVRGRAKQLDRLYLVRQHHATRLKVPDVYDWMREPLWLPSMNIFHQALVDEIVGRDGLTAAEADAVVKQAFCRYLAPSITTLGRYRPASAALPARIWRRGTG